MGYVDVPYNKVGYEIYLEIRGTLLKAVVLKMPFYQK
jgi:glycine cleavage system aminomethyltransferase T